MISNLYIAVLLLHKQEQIYIKTFLINQVFDKLSNIFGFLLQANINGAESGFGRPTPKKQQHNQRPRSTSETVQRGRCCHQRLTLSSWTIINLFWFDNPCGGRQIYRLCQPDILQHGPVVTDVSEKLPIRYSYNSADNEMTHGNSVIY